MTPAQLLRILVARRWTVVATLAVALAATALALAWMPRKYVATASIVVNGRADDPLRAATNAQGGPTVPTQVDIIKRSRVASRVVADLGLAKEDGWRAAWTKETGGQGELESWIAGVIAGGLNVASGLESNVVDLQYKSEDPQVAAKLANAFADAYLATMLELRTVPAGQYAGFFDERLRESRERLESAQQRLASFEKANDIVGNAGGRADVENARLGELSSQLAIAQGQLADSASRQRGASGAAAGSPDVLSYPVVQELRSKVAAQEVKMKEMQTRLKPDYPGFKSAQTELDELRGKLAAEMEQIAGSLATAQRVGASRVGAIQAALDQQRQRVLTMQALRDRDEVMRKEVESAQRTFDTLMQRQSQSAIEAQTRQSDASLLDHATVPFKPTSPRVPLVLLLGAVGGTLLGMLFAFALEHFRPVLRTVEDIVGRTGLPVLAVVPRAERSRRRGLLGVRRAEPALLH